MGDTLRDVVPSASNVQIEPIPCLADNYAYVLRVAGTRDAYVVDPSEVDPPWAALERDGLQLRGILATHHHPDHVGGIEALIARSGAEVWVAGHAQDRGRIPAQTAFIDAPRERFEPTGITIGGCMLLAAHIPGHTRAAIAWVLTDVHRAPTDVFSGDTLFAGGCGRLFEGTPAQMHASLQTLCSLPASTRIWFGHEYTATNLRFAATIEPDNAAISRRRADLPARTPPTTVAEELATNVFVRARDSQTLAERRAAKDAFR